MARQTRQQKAIDDIKNDLEELRNQLAEVKQKQEEDLEKRRKRKIDEVDSTIDDPAKKIPKPEKPSTLPPFSAKSFTLKHAFKKISTLKDNETRISPVEEHFGLHWILKIRRGDGYLHFHVMCFDDARFHTIETNMRMRSTNGKYCNYEKLFLMGQYKSFGKRGIINWEKRDERGYIVDDTFSVQVDLDIKKILGRKALRDFGESMAKYSDLVLKVQDQKFHVSKLFLASTCPYFEAMCLGPFQESGQSEIQLDDLDPTDVQSYLEVLYGHPAISEETVEGILLVADRNGTGIVKNKCQEFLLEKSSKPLRKKLQMFVKYHLDQKKIVAAFKTLADVQSINPKDLEDLDKNSAVDLLRKVINSK